MDIISKPSYFYFRCKSWEKNFSGQLEDYMQLEPNKNFIGFKYNFDQFKCYVICFTINNTIINSSNTNEHLNILRISLMKILWIVCANK